MNHPENNLMSQPDYTNKFETGEIHTAEVRALLAATKIPTN